MFSKFYLPLLLAAVGMGIFSSTVNAQTVDFEFGGVVLERCTVDSNLGGQLGFLKSGNITYGLTSENNGGSSSNVTISCNSPLQYLTVTGLEEVVPTPTSFQPISKRAEAVCTTCWYDNQSVFDGQGTPNNIWLHGSYFLGFLGGRTHSIEVNMQANQSTTEQLEAGTYRFNVLLTLTPF